MSEILIRGSNNNTNLALNSKNTKISNIKSWQETDELKNIVTLASETNSLSTLVELLSNADLVNTIKNATSLTVLAPTNSAFEAISSALATLDAAAVKDILLSHVIEGSVLSSDLTDKMKVKTLGSLELSVKITGNIVKFVAPGSEATVSSADIKASNGVVHLIDAVLLPKAKSKIALAYDVGGRGDKSFNDSAYIGAEKALKEFEIELSEDNPNNYDGDRVKLLTNLSEEKNELIIAIGFGYANFLSPVAKNYPNINFGIVDSVVEEPNVRGLIFAEEQGSFLVGVIAALKTKTNKIGHLSGVTNFPLLQVFEAGFRAGVKAVNPDIEVVTKHISEFPDFSGFFNTQKGKELSLEMYESGVDIIFHAAGSAGQGLFEAAAQHSESSGSKVWGIGVDSDQYNTVSSELKDYVLTSMLKRIDNAVYLTISDHLTNNFSGNIRKYDLTDNGVDYSRSGNFIEDIVDKVEEYKAKVIDGTIIVPSTL